ncbi:glycan biosynthesis hexose transferase WsfD [Streptacidiphilus albus]
MIRAPALRGSEKSSEGRGRPLAILARPWVFAPIIGTLAGLSMAIRLFLPGPIGMADNGDGPSRMCGLNLVAHIPKGSVRWFKFLNPRYGYGPPSACNATNTYTSSEQLLMHIAKPLSHYWGYPGAFDLRALGLLFCIIVAFVFTVFAAALRGHLIVRLLICAALFVVVGDTAFAGYAISPYSELAGLVGILFVAAGAMHFGGGTRAKQGGLLLFTAGALLAVTSKTQAVTLIVPFAALLLVVRVPLSGLPLSRLHGRFAPRLLPAVAALLIAASGVFTMQTQMKAFEPINRTEMIFDGVLGHSSDPSQTAKDLGLPQHFVQYKGFDWWAAHAPERDPQFSEIANRMTYGNIATYLVEHPGVATSITLGGMDAFAAAHPDYLGSYPAWTGHPAGTLESRLTLFSDFARASGRALVPGLLALGVFGFFWYRRLRDNQRRAAFVAVMVCMIGVVAAQFASAVYGEAIEDTKHLVYGIFAGGLAIVLTAAAAFCCPPGAEQGPGSQNTPLEAPVPCTVAAIG